MAVEQVLESLASDAGKAVVAAAATDAWGRAKNAFARLLGHSDPKKIDVYEGLLEEAHEELAAAQADGLDQARERLAAVWQARVLDMLLLEDRPGLAAELRSLVDQVQAAAPGGSAASSRHGIAAGRDVNITASRHGVAAGTMQVNVPPENPTEPGSASS